MLILSLTNFVCGMQFMYLFFGPHYPLLSLSIPKAGWNANKLIKKEEKREWDQKRKKCMNRGTQKC